MSDSTTRPLSPTQQRAQVIEQLQTQTFDVVVIGGGITGAAIARDAAMRGFKTALLERQDFASGASSKSARLVHGGVRYIESLQFGTVYHACAERHTLDGIAPHLMTPMPFTLALYEKPSRYLKARVGLWLYELLALFRNVERNHVVSSAQLTQLEPALTQHRLVGALRYTERATDDARLTLCTILCGQHWGSTPLNYAEARGIIKYDGQIAALCVRDCLSGKEFEVQSRLVVNATGAWNDIVRKLDSQNGTPSVRPNKGIHVVVSRQRLPIHQAITFPAYDGRRTMYAVPWQHTAIVGTTDTDYTGDLDHVAAEKEEVSWILESVNKCFPQAELQSEDLISSYAGLRPLIYQGTESAYRTSRDHQITVSSSGLISIVGGKLTTHRAMATDVVDRVADRLGRSIHCSTGTTPLYGWRSPSDDGSALSELIAGTKLSPTIVEHLVSTYSSEAPLVLQLVRENQTLQQPILADLPYIYAEIVYAMYYEMACTLNDVMIRRMHLIHETGEQGLECAAPIAYLMAQHLDWDSEETSWQIEAYRQQVAMTRQFRG